MGTAHNNAKPGDIAKNVIVVGDPLRAKNFAEKYLKDFKLINDVRNMFGYTGTYNGKQITIMGHGMGFGSVGIYTYELFKFYDVDRIIRVGTAGTYDKNLNLMDVVIGDKAFSLNNYGLGFDIDDEYLNATPELVDLAMDYVNSNKFDLQIKKGTIHSSEWFYSTSEKLSNENMIAKGCLAVEMEAYAIYAIAQVLKKQALTIVSISDSLVVEGLVLSPEDRATKLHTMVEIALNVLTK